ncbi:DUF6361 family protein [Methylotetracoccus oryzae]|uniref:DUF6361 family protein n=1 Tax=Methylotetracoccus oryzae TaxID=1919059 RepID=UPI0011194DB1|nr:DUF6361 family protein [Methylotetracoccus oryzae]
MSSSLTWLDHDSAARDRSLRILALFREKESRDELGIGGLRDAIADQLFPGTSTIQTRLRYMLVVPWIYQDLEQRRVPANTFEAQARKAELAIVKPLLENQEMGVFGAQAGSDLKRLPSSVYWAGLGEWGIRRYPGSQSDYYRAIDLLYECRVRSRQRDDDDTEAGPSPQSWHPRLPSPPADFPATLTLNLTQEEASFLRDCIVQRCEGSLLAWLALNGREDTTPEPWLHHQVEDFPASARELLKHASLLTDVVEGAARLYNLMLAELRDDEGLAAGHRNDLIEWQRRRDINDVRNWSLPELWEKTVGHGHAITHQTRRFVEAWIERVRVMNSNVADDAEGRRLIREREQNLKGPRSRFMNRGALAQWGGSSGVGRLVYRWPTARRFLGDLLPALGGG